MAAALAHAWEVALQALTQADAAEAPRAQASTPPALALSPARHAACRALGQQRPARWSTDVLSPPQRHAVLRCLMDQVVIQRAPRDQGHPRLVWRGGATTTCEVPVAVGALTDLPTAHDMAPQMRGLGAAGPRDDAIAPPLTRHGSRSPRRPAVLPSTVKGLRRTRGRMPQRSQSHPRRRAGDLTVPPLAQALAITPPWGSHQSTRGTVALSRAAGTGLSRCPDAPEPLEACRP